MVTSDFTYLKNEIALRQQKVHDYLFSDNNSFTFTNKHLEDALYSYVKAGGKSLRPAVLMFSAGVVGGDEDRAIPAAAAIELYHTYTLVHDDIIDRDELRRGVPTVHTDFASRGERDLQLDPATAAHYGLAIAILTGDIQQGWAASLLAALIDSENMPPHLVINLVRELFGRIQILLVNGEMLDITLAETPVDRVTDQQVLDMLWQKTGVLYEFAGRAGAAIGLDEPDLKAPQVEAVAQFTSKCGTAFQIQDDILGVVGNEAQLGKPVGSDIREGKRTLVVLHSLPNMTAAERTFTLGVLGNHDADATDIQDVIELLTASGGVTYAQNLARTYVQEALTLLDPLPESEYKNLLRNWATYIIEREF